MASVLQCRHRPSCLALCRLSCAAILLASLRSGRCRRRRSYSRRFSGLVNPLAGVGCGSLALLSGGGLAALLGFGSGVGLDFLGFVRRRLSPGFSRVGVDAGLLAGSYLPPNLLGSGTRSENVASTTRLGGAASWFLLGSSAGNGSPPAVQGRPSRFALRERLTRFTPGCAGSKG